MQSAGTPNRFTRGDNRASGDLNGAPRVDFSSAAQHTYATVAKANKLGAEVKNVETVPGIGCPKAARSGVIVRRS